MEWLIENYGLVITIFMVAEKLVKISPCEWDDIVVDGIKLIVQRLVNLKTEKK